MRFLCTVNRSSLQNLSTYIPLAKTVDIGISRRPPRFANGILHQMTADKDNSRLLRVLLSPISCKCRLNTVSKPAWIWLLIDIHITYIRSNRHHKTKNCVKQSHCLRILDAQFIRLFLKRQHKKYRFLQCLPAACKQKTNSTLFAGMANCVHYLFYSFFLLRN